MTRYYSYYSGNNNEDEGADMFDEYDPTPYEGGYDMSLTFGRPLAPSEMTCYRHSSGAASDDYDQPEFSSYKEPSAYDEDAVQEEYSSYARPPHDEGQYNMPKQNLGGSGGSGEYGGGRRSDSYDEEERIPAGEGGYGRKKHGTSPGGNRPSWWPGSCCTSDQAIQ